jgi:hypothetical protein
MKCVRAGAARGVLYTWGMRRTLLILSVLLLTSGIALADRRGGGNRGGGDRGGTVRDHRAPAQHWSGGGGGDRWSGGVHVSPTRSYEGRRPVIVERGRDRVRYERRPIYVQRPVIRYHYYDVHVRPPVYVENYDPTPGYYWVAGAWQWDGYEWIWQSGHYEPDPQYDDGYSYDGY